MPHFQGPDLQSPEVTETVKATVAATANPLVTLLRLLIVKGLLTRDDVQTAFAFDDCPESGSHLHLVDLGQLIIGDAMQKSTTDPRNPAF